MSEEDPLVDGQPLSSLRVVDLREALDKHGLSKSGNKKELAERLREYLVNGTMETSPTKSADLRSPTKSPENSLVAAYKARQAAALNKASEERERVRRESENEVSKVETPKKAHLNTDEGTPKAQVTDNDNNESEGGTNVAQSSPSRTSEVLDKKQTEPIESANESPPKEANKSIVKAEESPNVADDHENKSVSPSPEEEETSIEDNKGKESVEMENDNDDHVELDYGDGDVDDPTTEEDAKSTPQQEKVESVSTPQVTKSRRIEAPASDDVAKDAPVSSNGKTRAISPSRYPASEILHIRGLMRPFTIPLLKSEICKGGGEIVDFWIDNIRSHCFVKMRSVNEATVSRNSLHGTHWPISNPKSLVVQFDTQDNMERHKNGEAAAPISASRTISAESHDAKTERGDRSERRDRPTLAPLAGRNGLKVTLETMVRDNNKKEEEERERREKEGKEKAKEIEKKMKDRELKMLREKEERENRKRQRSETPPHSRTELKKERRDSPERKERRRNDSEMKKEEKIEPEKPVKTADEYFKKTIAQPSIYYLPLSEEEAVARSAKKERHR